MYASSLAPAPFRAPAPAPRRAVLRRCACGGSAGPEGECEGCRKKRLGLQRSAAAAGPAVAPRIVHDVLAAPGRPLDGGTRARMEPRFGHSFAQVRVHDDARAAASARAVGAHAYTVGRDVVFGAGRYRPGSGEGQALLAHELAHVVQQGGASAAGGPLEIGRADDPAEREAEEAARGGSAGSITLGGLRLSRQPMEEMDGPAGTLPFERNRRGGRRRPGSTLPYREATEYAECLRIMGEENREYCREEVLGERPPPPPGDSNPMHDISTFQSPGASGWWGAKFGCYRNACSRRHRGWDLHAPEGTDVLAVRGGRATRHNDPGGFGEFMRLVPTGQPDVRYHYAHLSVRGAAGTYAAGDVIGQTGVTGNASADRPHLHFQVERGGTAVDPIGEFSEPTMVIEAAGSAAAVIDKTLPEPCAPC